MRRIALALVHLAWAGTANAQQTPAPAAKAVPGFEEPARLVRAKGWAWDHQVRVWLPPSYRSTQREYPTVWVTDNSLELVRTALVDTARGPGPEVIVVSVGAPPGTPFMESQLRRRYDFLPQKSLMGPMYAPVAEGDVGGAPGFLDFLVNQLRPMLAREYRMDPVDHAYVGHSGGAMFGLYTLFTRPESFTRYLISSPATSQTWLDLEEAWFREHKDLKARVFLSAGELESRDTVMAAQQVTSTVALVAERLTVRKYPSLDFAVRFFSSKTHLSVRADAFAEGIRYLWSK